MTPKELFNKAYNLISDPKKWTQGAFARDKFGSCVTKVRTSAAVCFCSAGAVMRFSVTADDIDVEDSIFCALENTQHNFTRYNDTHTHAEVMAMWRETGEREGWL